MGGNSFFNLTTMKKTLQIGFYILISLFIFTQSSCQDKTFDDESNSENSGNDSSDEGDDNEETLKEGLSFTAIPAMFIFTPELLLRVYGLLFLPNGTRTLPNVK